MLLAFLNATLICFFLLCAIFAPTMSEKCLFIVLLIVSMFNFGVAISLLAKESEVNK
jgi:hypothetical protein